MRSVHDPRDMPHYHAAARTVTTAQHSLQRHRHPRRARPRHQVGDAAGPRVGEQRRRLVLRPQAALPRDLVKLERHGLLHGLLAVAAHADVALVESLPQRRMERRPPWRRVVTTGHSLSIMVGR
ncbi:hypothetical protein [Herbidospora cretacea]|uniref:hypothetical protein n=1 Tax=Herbidospora cretacea TaxID=28444 RepID=UPI0012DEF4BF|nr:hypothetical protein [Herbidospora cretacea]